jgi:hypothetical protein
MGGKRTLREFVFLALIGPVRAIFLCAVFGSLAVPADAVETVQPASTSVCKVASDAAKLIGKRLRVDGYVSNLGAHGFVLVGKRRDCEGQLVLRVRQSATGKAWRMAWNNGSLGPKRAILVGTVGWLKARYGDGRNPALTVEQVVYLSPSDSNQDDF